MNGNDWLVYTVAEGVNMHAEHGERERVGETTFVVQTNG